MHVHWNLNDPHRWDAFADLAGAGLAQSGTYGQAMAQLGVPCLRAVVTAEASPKSAWIGAGQFIVQRLPWFVRFAFCQGGPLWAPGTGLSDQQAALALIRSTLPLRRPRMALFSPWVDALQASTPGERHAFEDRLRVATGRSTVLMDLTQPEAQRRAALEGRWRNRLNAAERSPLKIRTCGSRPTDTEWLVNAEAQQRRERRYLTLPTGFVPAFQSAHRKPSQALLTLAADLQRQPCAGMMFLLHGRTATYHLGWTNEDGRTHSAHNLLLWEGCRMLAERGIEQLDLGGVNTETNPGLARFKLGSGGRVVTWIGTYL